MLKDVDIDKDGKSAVKVKLLNISKNDSTLSITDLSTLNDVEILDQTIGGVTPFGVKNHLIDFSFVENKDELVLLYSGGGSRWIAWERYNKNGNQVNTPSFGEGKLNW
ncbi:MULTISPECIES: hypothetical protein [Caldisericum]|uniref:Uncharacterized protein n=1 Tax=Caldisericum exile TaxID=693075 RepID=A0A2J6WEN1_9BACT|nr:MAG: hypothetical protein C0189_02730 [Caldisericum exile]